MSHAFRNSCLLAVVGLSLVVSVACRQQEGRWDEAQRNSDGKSAQQSSADRIDEGDSAAYADPEDLGPPPAFNPEAGGATGATDWSPSGLSDQEVAVSSAIDLDALTSGDPLPGSSFNKFFPEQGGDYDMVAKQEKQGFAQYSLRRGGEEIAQLSVTDLRSNPQAAQKFQDAEMNVGGYPAVKDGSKGTTLLVEGRFQVKVRSPTGSLNENDRKSWLQKFDLNGISSLAN